MAAHLSGFHRLLIVHCTRQSQTSLSCWDSLVEKNQTFYLSDCPLMAWLNSSKQCHNVHCHWYQVAHQHAIWKPFLKWKAPPSWSLDNATSSPRHEPCQGTNLDQIWVGMGLGTYTWWQVMRLPFQLVSSARISWKLKPYVRIISLDIIMNVITYHCSVWIGT